MKISCVLITKEEQYPQSILDLLDFDEILIETKCPSILRRYELAQKARNDIIYVQDDDVLPNFKLLIEKYNGQLTNAITEHHFNWYKDSGITLVGFGTLFPKKMIDFSRYLDKYPADPLFLREADRVFTYLNQPFNSIVLDIKNLPSASSEGRMSTSAGHYESLELIKQRLWNLDNTH